MSKSLFNDFDPVSSKQWKQKIQVDLKGADYNTSLIWNSNEGIDVKPFYHSDQTNNRFNIPKSTLGWKIGQLINVTNEKESNNKVLDAIQRGAEAITCLLYTSPSPRDLSTSRMPSSA